MELAKGVNLEFREVTKTFRRGNGHGSMRDAIPALARTLFRKPGRDPQVFESLSDVSFQVRSGECLGIIGPNGAGKSTLLKCASRILRPNQGSVEIRGRVSALIEVGAGFHPDLTGRENIFLNGTILGMRRVEIAKRLDQIVEFAGLAEFIDTPAKRYSSGMFARLGFAVAVFVDPDVLLIDEVLSVGDRAFTLRCEQKIHELRQSGTAILFVSHNLAAVRSICDRVLVLAGGKMVHAGKPDEAIRFYHQWMLDREGEQEASSIVTHVALRSQDDGVGASDDFAAGEVVELEVEVCPTESLPGARLEISLRDSQETLIYQTSTPSRYLQAGTHASQVIRLTLNLLPGTYWLGLAVYGRCQVSGRQQLVEWRPNRLPITIRGDSEATGTANLFAVCQCHDKLGSQQRANLLMSS